MKSFLDKNPLFDYGRYELFDELVRPESLTLVKKIMSDDIKVYISPDTPFALYNYLRYKLERPEFKGGKELSTEEAEKKSRDFTKEIFAEGGWSIVPIDISDIRCAFADDRFEEAEDAFQFYCAKKTDVEFITWNTRHFKDRGIRVVTPKTFLDKQK